MSTICKIAVPAHADSVTPVLGAFLRERNVSFSLTNTEWPAAGERDNFIVGNEFPSIFSAKQVTPEVTEIHFNSFGTLNDLASRLSSAVAKHVVVNIYQSVSTASHWALYGNGNQLRMIEAGDGHVTSHRGDRLPFEGSEPGRMYEDEGYTFVCFDSDEQDWYNFQVGVPVEVYQDSEAGWTNWILTDNVKPTPPEVSRQKPFWRFW